MNKVKKRKVVIGEDSTSRSQEIIIYDIDSLKPGPKLYIQSSVHGAELQGNLVIHHLQNYFLKNSFNGSLRLVALANPEASSHKSGQYTSGRFNPQTGHNWNRNYYDIFDQKYSGQHGHSIELFFDNAKTQGIKTFSKLKEAFKKYYLSALESYEKSTLKYGQPHNGMLNLSLQKLSSHADIILDLHTGPKACRYLYSPEYAAEDALSFGYPYILKIPTEFAGAMDEASFIPWVRLINHMKERSLFADDIENQAMAQVFNAFTLELGSEEVISNELAHKDCAGILNYLINHNILARDQISPEYSQLHSQKISLCHLSDYKTYYCQHGSLTEFLKSPGESYAKGDLLAMHYKICHDLDSSELFKTFQTCAQSSGIIINHYCSSATPKGCELYQVMENIDEKVILN